jgi:sulfite exporter TauE/SafE/copper chaperone CopZ
MSGKFETKRLIVKGMHCKSCETLITGNVMKIDGVNKFKVDYGKGKAEVEHDPQKTDVEKIMEAIQEKGYECEESHDHGARPKRGWKSIGTALGFAVVILGAYIIAQSSFISAVPDLGTNASLLLIFTIGLLTGFHCIGMCGGFMVSYTTKNAMDDQSYERKPNRLSRIKPHLSYSTGKLISYAIVGAGFGLIGSFFAFTGPTRGIMAVAAGILMIIMGLNMLNVFPFLRRVNFSGLGFLGKRMSGKNRGPFMLGIFTGLMPCGPLIAMELYAAGTGSALLGATALLVFGLGTLPVMNIFGATLSVLSMSFTKRILKISAVVVMVLGVIMLSRGMTLSGVGFNLNSVSASAIAASDSADISGGIQQINMTVDASGWMPDMFVLKKGMPVQWNIDVKQLTSCNSEILVPAYNLDIKLKPGLNVVEFTPTQEGTISWSCWMGMIPGTFIVKHNIDINSQTQVKAALSSAPAPKASGGCGCGGGRGKMTCGG